MIEPSTHRSVCTWKLSVNVWKRCARAWEFRRRRLRCFWIPSSLISIVLSISFPSSFRIFNDMFGNINWNDADNVRRQILEVPEMVSRDERYQNAMRNSDKQEARTESDCALQKIFCWLWPIIWNCLNSIRITRITENGWTICSSIWHKDEKIDKIITVKMF